MNNEQELLKRITIVPGLMGGKPTIRAMRFTVADIYELLAAGLNNQEIIEQFPFLENDDIVAALVYASLRTKNTLVINAA